MLLLHNAFKVYSCYITYPLSESFILEVYDLHDKGNVDRLS